MLDVLRLDPNAYTLKDLEVEGKKVVYKEYKSLCYCEKPVDDDYQSLDIRVPVSVDGKPIDCTDAPILFAVNVAGYTASPNKGNHAMGPGAPASHADPHGRGPGGPGGMPGMPPMGGPGGMPGMPPMGGPGGPPGEPGGKGPDYVANLCLALGFVCVNPGARGRNCEWPDDDPRAKDGKYYGKAPAAMVDLKAAVRYIRHNRDLIPGNTDHIVTHGGSAGGGLSCLLAASGDSPEYQSYLEDIGAAQESDRVFASASFSPVMNLENGDGAYEFEWSHVPYSGGPFSQVEPHLVNQDYAQELKEAYRAYLESCHLVGHGDFGPLNMDNMGEYCLKEYLIPEAKRFMDKKTPEEKAQYLAQNPWLHPQGDGYSFTFQDFALHAGREKDLPAFDEFPLNNAETLVFGSSTQAARHFTPFALQKATENPNAQVDPELQHICQIFNPMWHVLQGNPGCSQHWWIRHGGVDGATSVPTVLNLATALENQGKAVNARIIWDGGHCEDDDPDGLIAWYCQICDYTPQI